MVKVIIVPEMNFDNSFRDFRVMFKLESGVYYKIYFAKVLSESYLRLFD